MDAVYMDATTSMTGHGGWPMTCVLDHDGNPFFAGTYFPDQPRHGQPSFRQVLEALTDAWQTKPEDVRRVAGNLREHLGRADGDGCGRDHRGDARAGGHAAGARLRRRQRRLRRLAEVPAVDGARVPAPTRSPADGAWTPSRRWLAAASTTSSAAASRATRSTRPGWCRTSRRCSTTTPSCSGSTRGSEARSATGSPARPPTSCSASWAPPRAGFASALDADSEGVEGKFYAWSPQELVEVLGPDDGAWAAEALEVTTPAPSSTAAPPCSAWSSPDTSRLSPGSTTSADGCSRRVGSGSGRLATTRWSPPGTGWPSPASATPACDSATRRTSTRRSPPVSCCGGCTSSTAGCGGSRATASWARQRACWRTTAAWRPASSPSCRRPATRCGSTAPGPLLDAALERFRAEDGGFFDTAADAEALVARPRDPGDNASPVRSVVDGPRAGRRARAHRRGPLPPGRRGGARHRRDARRAGAPVRRLVARRRPDDAGRPARGRGRRPGRARSATRSRSAPGSTPAPSWSRRTARATTSRCCPAGPPVDGRAAAYVCRGFVCERPVTRRRSWRPQWPRRAMVASSSRKTHWGMDVMRTGDPNNFANGSWPGGTAPDWPWPAESPKVLLRRLEILSRRRLGPDQPAEEFELAASDHLRGRQPGHRSRPDHHGPRPRGALHDRPHVGPEAPHVVGPEVRATPPRGVDP